MSAANSSCKGPLRPLAAATAIVLAASGAVLATPPTPAQAADPVWQAPTGDQQTGYTVNAETEQGASIYFFDFNKLVKNMGRDSSMFNDSKMKTPRKMMQNGDYYTFTSKDGLPPGVEATVKITGITHRTLGTSTPMGTDLGIAAGKSEREYSDVFTAAGKANYGPLGYQVPVGGVDGAWWMLTNARKQGSANPSVGSFHTEGAGTMSFTV